MLDPNLGIVNAFGEDVLGWEQSIPFLSERSSDVTILGVSSRHSDGAPQRHRLPGMALLPVRVPVHPRPSSGGAGRPRRGRQGGRRVAAAALPLHPASAALRRDRAARGPALHLDLQRVRRHLPADRRRGRHRGGVDRHLQSAHRPRRHRRGGGLLARARRPPRSLPLPLFPVLRQERRGRRYDARRRCRDRGGSGRTRVEPPTLDPRHRRDASDHGPASGPASSSSWSSPSSRSCT